MSSGAHPAESALAIALPELVHIVGAYRSRYTQDGGSAPPHITLMHPFLVPSEITPSVLQRIAGVVCSIQAFECSVTSIATFPKGLIYLTPEPCELLIEMISRLSAAFPDAPTYWKTFGAIVPHITIADTAMVDHPGLIEEMKSAISRHLPYRCSVREVLLLQQVQRTTVTWELREHFPLGER